MRRSRGFRPSTRNGELTATGRCSSCSSRRHRFGEGLSVERANHLLLFFAGADAYHALVDVYGWTHEEWIDWAVLTVAEQVFGRSQFEANRLD